MDLLDDTLLSGNDFSHLVTVISFVQLFAQTLGDASVALLVSNDVIDTNLLPCN